MRLQRDQVEPLSHAAGDFPVQHRGAVETTGGTLEAARDRTGVERKVWRD